MLDGVDQSGDLQKAERTEHTMTEQDLTPRPGDDTLGHARREAEDTTGDDSEGHGFHHGRESEDTTGDDTEGHAHRV
jgi:hypothetical protein